MSASTGIRRLGAVAAAAALTALVALPGCILVADQEGWDKADVRPEDGVYFLGDWVDHGDGHSLARLEARIAAMEAHMATCPCCRALAASHDEAEAEGTPFVYDLY